MTLLQLPNWLKRHARSRARRRRRTAPRGRIPLAAEPLEERCVPTGVIHVTNTQPDGPGSLEQAILDANATPGLDLIDFHIGQGLQVIQPNDPGLDPITDEVAIDGSLVPGQQIELDGINVINGRGLGPSPIGLWIETNYCMVHGLAIVNFSKEDAQMGFMIGAGIVVDGFYNTIDGNVISTDYQSTVGIGNAVGIAIEGTNEEGAQLNTISNNTIAASFSSGLFLNFAEYNLVEDNFIGTDSQGHGGLGNGKGVSIILSDFNTIQNNTIAGSTGGPGIDLRQGSSSNTVFGNFIGVAGDGVTPIPNSSEGINIDEGAHDNHIGLPSQPPNVIAANLIGIAIAGADTSHNQVANSFIGVDANLHPLGNKSDGILIGLGASANLIGGAETEGNFIAYNGHNGITIDSLDPIGTQILSNSIFANAALGIDLGDDGATLNTPGGPHTGPNHFQNYPVITVAGSSNGFTDIYATINTSPDTRVVVQFFSSPSPDPSGYGEGLALLGTAMVTTDSLGNAFAALVVPIDLDGLFITSTALNVADSSSSEFSHVRQVRGLAPTVGGFNEAVLQIASGEMTETINGSGFVGSSPSGAPGS